jgi:hypothetical protein
LKVAFSWNKLPIIKLLTSCKRAFSIENLEKITVDTAELLCHVYFSSLFNYLALFIGICQRCGWGSITLFYDLPNLATTCQAAYSLGVMILELFINTFTTKLIM